MSQSSRILFAALAALSLAACGTAPSHSQNESDRRVGNPTSAQIDPARVSIAPIEWEHTDRLTDSERASLSEHLQQVLSESMAGLPPVTNGRAAELHAYVSDVDTVSAGLNLLSAALLMLPLDGGGAKVRFEAIDPATGEQLILREFAYRAPLTSVRTRFHRLAPVNKAIETATHQLTAEMRDSQ